MSTLSLKKSVKRLKPTGSGKKPPLRSSLLSLLLSKRKGSQGPKAIPSSSSSPSSSSPSAGFSKDLNSNPSTLIKTPSNSTSQSIKSGSFSTEISSTLSLPPPPPLKPIFAYSPQDKILCLGEGNFSFASSLLTILGSLGLDHDSFLATSLDSTLTCEEKYGLESQTFISSIQESGGSVIQGVDGTLLPNSLPSPWNRFKWDRILINFPHVGAGIKDQSKNILENQKMLVSLFRSCIQILSDPIACKEVKSKSKSKSNSNSNSTKIETSPSTPPPPPPPKSFSRSSSCLPSQALFLPLSSYHGGELHITLKEGLPYTLWDLKGIAKREGWTLRTSFRFSETMWSGYEHRRTLGFKDGLSKVGNLEIAGKGRTWVFYKNLPKFDDSNLTESTSSKNSTSRIKSSLKGKKNSRSSRLDSDSEED